MSNKNLIKALKEELKGYELYGKAKRAEEWKNSSGGDRRKSWNEIQMENPLFNAFYKAMNFIADEEEFQSFLTHLKNPLPACFRINADYASFFGCWANV